MKISKKIIAQLLLTACISTPTGILASNTSTPTIGIIVPIEHRAMTEIVSGFKAELAGVYQGKVNVIVKNAQGDSNIEKSIISQFAYGQVDIIEPIGTDALEMTLSQTSKTPIVGIAADFSESDRANALNHNITNVLDEVSPKMQLRFIHAAYPALKKISLIYSADNKVIPEVSAVKHAGKQLGIDVQGIMITQLSDMYTAGNHIDKDSDAIFILKDNTVVNAIATLTQQAELRHIPLISSDEGSVADGAAFALGVRERDIGIKAADITAKILNGQPVSTIPTTTLSTYHVFINEHHAATQQVDIKSITKTAKQMGYGIVIKDATREQSHG